MQNLFWDTLAISQGEAVKLIHLSDLHIGKRVNEYSMLEDQQHILGEILKIIDKEQPDAVLLAGDLYDRPVPSAEAVCLFDRFLSALAERKRTVLAVSGNHDSPERIAFGTRLMQRSGVFFAPVYGGALQPVTLRDEFGEVDFYLLPFLKPAMVRRFFPEKELESYTDALRAALPEFPAGREDGRRRVLVAHQFVTGASRSESEELSVGGTDNVDAAAFADFDYTALGHLHSPQNVGTERIRYCGTPLKYSFSEARQQKSVTVAELGPPAEDGFAALRIRAVPLTPLRDMRELRGSYMEVTARDFYAGSNREDYMHVTLTDEEDIPGAVDKLRTVYHNLMKLDYDNRRTRSSREITADTEAERKTPLELFAEFYEKQNNAPLGEQERQAVAALIEHIWDEQQER